MPKYISSAMIDNNLYCSDSVLRQHWYLAGPGLKPNRMRVFIYRRYAIFCSFLITFLVNSFAMNMIIDYEYFSIIIFFKT